MAITSFLKFFDQRQPPQTSATGPSNYERLARRSINEVPIQAFYPPRDIGLPTDVDPDDIVSVQKDTLARLRELTVADRLIFEASYLTPLRTLARLVHLLPASASDHYSAPAGLFKMCLDLAYYSLQSADGKIFTPHESVEQRHKNEPRWRYATFLAALSCQIHRSLTMLTVTNDRGDEWPRFSIALTDWFAQTGAKRYYVNWHSATNISGGEGAAVLNQVAPKERLDWLAQGDIQIIRDMHQVAMGASHQADSIMARVITGITRKVMEVDESIRRTRYGRLTVGTHVEPYILDAMREAIESGQWRVNQVGSPVWFGSDGLFIEWPMAHADVLAYFARNNLAGMPRSSVSIAEFLGKAGLIIQAETGLWVRDMLVPAQKGGPRDKAVTGLRFVNAMVIFGHLSVENASWPFGAELVTAEMMSGSALAATVQAKPAAVVSGGLPAAPIQATAASSPPPMPALPVAAAPVSSPVSGSSKIKAERAVGQKEPIAPSASVPPTVDATGEIAYSELVKPEVRRWLKSSDVAETVGHLIYLHGKHRGEIVKSMPYGVALCVNWITDQSPTDISQFVKVFEANRWLGRPTGTKNEAMKLHDVQFDDAVKRAIVLSLQGAATLGFSVSGGVP